jgi:hypothetical protein
MGDYRIRIPGDVTGWEYDKESESSRNREMADIPVINMEDNVYHPCQGCRCHDDVGLFGRDLRFEDCDMDISGSTKKPITPS